MKSESDQAHESLRVSYGIYRHSRDTPRRDFLRVATAGVTSFALSRHEALVSAGTVQMGCSGVMTTEWTRFRGPNGAGVASDKGYPSELGASSLLWRRSIPGGKSSPVLSRSSIFLTAERDRSLVLLCLERSTGELKWERTIQADRKEPRHSLNHAASSTAVTDGENVYAFFGDYGLVSYDSTGKERWRVPLGPFTIGWGPASSPVLVDDAIVIPLDGYVDSHISAFESRTGKLRWRKERDPYSHNYSTPIVRSTDNGRCEIVVLGPNKVVATIPATVANAGQPGRQEEASSPPLRSMRTSSSALTLQSTATRHFPSI